MSSASVIRAEQFANGVDAAEEAVPGIKQEILTGSIKPTEKAVAAIAKAPQEERPALVQQLRQTKEPEKSTKTKKSPKRSPRKSRNVSAVLQKPCKPSGKRRKRCSSPPER